VPRSGRRDSEKAAFIPIAALIVDFGLTIAISTAAAASAIIAFFPPSTVYGPRSRCC
jgi:hypothetical protein